MPQHVVSQGECISSIARMYGFPDWRIIWNHPENADFKKKRPNANVLHPGDKLFVQDRELQEKDCATDQRHRFVLKKPTTWVHFVVEDVLGQKAAGKKY